MAAIDDGMLAQQDDLAVADTHGLRFGFRPGRAQVLAVRVPLQLGGDFPGLPHLDLVTQDQPVQDIVKQRFGHARGGDDAAGMQRHVALLDALGGQRPKRREVLSESDRRHDLSQLRGGFHAQQAHIQRRRGIGFQGAADGAHLDRHLDAAAQVAILVGPPLGERRIALSAGRVGMRPGLDGAPVVARGDGDGVDAVHNPLVVGGRPVRVHRRKVGRDDDAVADLFARVVVSSQRRVGNRAPGPGERAIRQVGKNAQEDLPAGDGLDQRRDAFAHSVGEIGPHGIAGIHEQVDNQRGLAAGRQSMGVQFDIPAPPPRATMLG